MEVARLPGVSTNKARFPSRTDTSLRLLRRTPHAGTGARSSQHPSSGMGSVLRRQNGRCVSSLNTHVSRSSPLRVVDHQGKAQAIARPLPRHLDSIGGSGRGPGFPKGLPRARAARFHHSSGWPVQSRRPASPPGRRHPLPTRRRIRAGRRVSPGSGHREGCFGSFARRILRELRARYDQQLFPGALPGDEPR